MLLKYRFGRFEIYAGQDIDATVGYIAAHAMLDNTVKVARTTTGIAEPQAVFSACYARICYYIFLNEF